MPKIKEDPLASMISGCNRCGFCQDVCPTYGVTQNEFDVARGRIRMIRMIQEGQYDLAADKAILNQVDQCLLCGACTQNCPSKVPTDKIMQMAREKILKIKGFSLFHNLLYRGLLTRQARLEKISALIRILDRADLRTRVAKMSAARAFTFLSNALTYLPTQLPPSARNQLPPLVQKKSGPDICYFMGCGTNVFTPAAGLATKNCLEMLGFSVSIPRVPCCGGPHFSAGDMPKARTLARENIAILLAQNPDTIVTDCATCAHTLHDYSSFFPINDPLQADIRVLAEKITDINTFVLKHLGTKLNGPQFTENRLLKKNTPGPADLRVTYHDPCHAVRGLKVSWAPRNIIDLLPGLKRVEMEGADTCCGGAGSYSFRNPGMSQKILNQKIDAIAKTGADIVATSCPSCILQLSAGLRRKNLDVRVMHPMELVSDRLTPLPGTQNPTPITISAPPVKNMDKGNPKRVR